MKEGENDIYKISKSREENEGYTGFDMTLAHLTPYPGSDIAYR
jgi:hypothetical protein